MKRKIILQIFVLFILATSVSAFSSSYPNVVHEYITNESQEVWSLIPYEIKNHLRNSLDITIYPYIPEYYNSGDDIIDGSGEEDAPVTRAFEHFWESDHPQDGIYNDGLKVLWIERGSSYTKALEYWKTKVIPYYIKGEIDKSYYWLGRVAHLLEDAAVPEHMHLDCHPGSELISWTCDASSGDNGNDDSSLEKYTANPSIFQTYKGSDYSNQQYDYDNLIPNFDWSQVEPTKGTQKQNIELFRLFWYTAQKTQYFASDDVDRDFDYTNLNGNTQNWDYNSLTDNNLWKNESYTNSNFITQSQLAIDDPTNNGQYVQAVANATIPHAMKAVAGLYRLFDDAVKVDWPYFHHDLRRTGFTLLKGDLYSASDATEVSYTVGSSIDAGHLAKPSIADLDNNGKQEVVVATSNSSGNGKIYSMEREFWSYTPKWEKTVGEQITAAPSLKNIDSDDQKEVVFGLPNGTIFIYDGKTGTEQNRYYVEEKYVPRLGFYYQGQIRQTAVEDIDLDGDEEIIFAESHPTIYDFPGEVYILSKNLEPEGKYKIGNGGANGALSIANIDNDDYPEIIIPAQFGGIYVLDYNPAINNLSLKWSNSDSRIEGAPAIADVDRDNEYELIYTTSSYSWGCTQVTCYNKTYIRDALTGNLEKSISLNGYARVTPTIANLDSDSNLEIVITVHKNYGGYPAKIECYDAVTGNACSGWPYTDNNNLEMDYISPNIVDINNDNVNDILILTEANEAVFLENDGTELFSFNIVGNVNSAPAIGDIDNDGRAEIAVRRSGSEVISDFTSTNRMPILNNISNISAVEGDLIFLNSTGEITATDYNNNSLTFYYSSPFNESGYWQTDCDSAGNYSVLIEVSDGNLSDWQYIIVEINNTCSTGKELQVSSLSQLSSNNPRIFEFITLNNAISVLDNVSWSFYTGESIINNNQNISLNPNEDIFVFIEYNYSNPSTSHTVNATVKQSNLTDYMNKTFGDLLITTLKEIYSNVTNKIFEFDIQNNIASNINNINWTFDTGEDNIFAKQLIDLNSSETIFVFVENSYSSDGVFIVTVNATNNSLSDKTSLSTTITKNIDLSNLTNLSTTGNSVIIEFIITNMMDANLTNINWTANTNNQVIKAANLINLIPLENIFVYNQYDYGSSGLYLFNATAKDTNTNQEDSEDITIKT